MRGVLATALGVALVVVTLRDVVHELFDPEESGSLTRALMRGVWRAVRVVARRRRSVIHRAGALVLLSVAAMWTGMLTLGFALLYWPRLPAGFHVDPTLPASATTGFPTALYVSLGSLTTIGSSDVVPLADGMRYAGTLESLLGVALITAWITWVLSVYPVLAQRRAFACEVNLVRHAYPPPAQAVAEGAPGELAGLLRSLAEQVVRLTSELSQTRVSYYFQNPDPALALATQLPYALALARAAEGAAGHPALRRDGALLRRAVETMCDTLGEQFLSLRGAPPERVIEALAEDHLLRPEGQARR
jgi:hypothetical protein